MVGLEGFVGPPRRCQLPRLLHIQGLNVDPRYLSFFNNASMLCLVG
jgi:hypothetical protein